MPTEIPTAARAKLAARARRVTLLRRRVAASTLATFALAWGVVAWTGSMGTETTTTASTTAAAATTTESSSAPSSSTDSSSSSSSAGGSSSSSSDDAAVTTAQS